MGDGEFDVLHPRRTTVSRSKLESSSVDSSKIQTNAVGSSEIAAGAVDTSELQTDAVTRAKLDHDIWTSSVFSHPPLVCGGNSDPSFDVPASTNKLCFLSGAGGEGNCTVRYVSSSDEWRLSANCSSTNSAICSMSCFQY